MTDYERVTTRETTAVDPVADPMTASPAVASTVRTTDGVCGGRARVARPRPPAS